MRCLPHARVCEDVATLHGQGVAQALDGENRGELCNYFGRPAMGIERLAVQPNAIGERAQTTVTSRQGEIEVARESLVK